MPFINLIAEQRAQLRATNRKLRLWFLTFATVAGFGVLAFAGLFVRATTLKAEIADLKRQSAELQPLKDGISRNQQALLVLKPRMETLLTARHSTERWSRILDHMSLVMPGDTWLTNVTALQAADVSKPTEVTWQGMSSEQNLVGELMLRMQQSPDFAAVTLKYTETKGTQWGVGLEFSISTQVAGTGEKFGKLGNKEATQS